MILRNSYRRYNESKFLSDIYKPLFPPEKFLVRETPSKKNCLKMVKQYFEISVKRFNCDDKNPLMVYIQMYQEAPIYTGYLKGKTVYLPLDIVYDFLYILEDVLEKCYNYESERFVKSVKTSPKSEDIAVEFPLKLKLDGSNYVIAHEIKTITDVKEAENKGTELAFAFYWTSRHLKQFRQSYGEGRITVSSFKDDLDVCQVLHVSEKETLMYCISLYTEALYTIYPEDLEEFEGLRMSHGVEFQVYKKFKNNELLFPPEKFLVRETPSTTDPSKTVKQYFEVSVKRFDGDDENPLMVYIQMYQEAPTYTGYLKGKTVYLPLGTLVDLIDALTDISEECDQRGLE